jgi:XRE family transcriptional regulator, regulator of sulfur utilization
MACEPRRQPARRATHPGYRPVGAQPSIGQRLTDVLEREGYSASKLAEVSGIPVRTLQAVFAGTAAPTITILWRIANAVGVPFGSLLPAPRLTGMAVQRRDEQALFSADGGRFVSRPLFPFDSQRLVEFYELTVAAGYVHESQAHAPGTVENLVVSTGELKVRAGNEPPRLLRVGDAAAFQADVQHSYENTGAADAVVYLVISYVNLAE